MGKKWEQLLPNELRASWHIDFKTFVRPTGHAGHATIDA